MGGPAMGMTQILVTGQSFTRATRVLLDDVPITPDGGIVDSATAIRGFTNAHDPGVVPVVAETGNSLAVGPAFTFAASPVLRRISPNNGPSAGGTVVTIVGSHFVCAGAETVGTRFSVGANLVRADIMVTDCAGSNRILAIMPPYPGPPAGIGPVTLFAWDPVAGESTLPDAFAYVSLRATLPADP